MSSDRVAEGGPHVREIVQHHALPMLMITLGVVGALLVSSVPEQSSIGMWLYVALVESKELWFWLYALIAGQGTVLMLISEVNRRRQS